MRYADAADQPNHFYPSREAQVSFGRPRPRTNQAVPEGRARCLTCGSTSRHTPPPLTAAEILAHEHGREDW